MKLLLAVNMLFLCTIGTSSYVRTDDQAEDVSLIQLIATPERFNGKHVNVTGFLHLGYEAASLYLSKEDYDHVILDNTLYIDVTDEIAKDKDKLNLKYVRLQGTFRAKRPGRTIPESRGTITKITYFKLWSDPAAPLEQQLHKRSGTN